MKKKRWASLLSGLLVLLLVLSACGGQNATTHVNTEKENQKIPETVTNGKKAIKDGTLYYGVGTDTPFKGIFNPIFSVDNIDQPFINFFYPSLFKKTKDNEIVNGGAANVSYSKDYKTITVKLNKQLNWTDGKPVTSDDYIFAFEAIGHKDYQGYAYTSVDESIKGMAAYHAGKAKTISGLKKINDKTVQITFDKADPNVKTDLLSYPLEKSAFKGIPVSKMASSAPVRKHPVGYGPFKIQSIVAGESVTFVRNDDYFAGKPKLKKVYASIVNPKIAKQKLKNGEVDLIDYAMEDYNPKTIPSNVKIVAMPEVSHFDLAFKLGHFDKQKGENVTNPKAKMADVHLRRAMGYALNNKEVSQKLFKGLRVPATSYIAPGYKEYHDSSLKGYTYNPKKAKQILDKAGYKDRDKDGYREDPSGKKLVIQLAASGQEALTKYYIQNWKSVGLHVKLTNNRLIDFNSFYDRLGNDDKDIDIYLTYYATNIDPTDQFGRHSQNNLTRYTSTENDALTKQINAPESFDSNYRRKVLFKWQKLVEEDAPEIPLFYTYSLMAVNKRVTRYSAYTGYNRDYDGLLKLGVSEKKPIKAK